MIELIAKNKAEKFEFNGSCKLTIDSLSHVLLVEPFIEDFKMISAMFKWEFVASKNILFVFAEFSFQDFALIFDDSNKCNKVYDFLLKKGANAGNNELIKERFLSPFFNEIPKSNESNVKFKKVLIDWIGKLCEKEKNEYIQFLKDKNVYDLIFPHNDDEIISINPCKRKAKDISCFRNGKNMQSKIKSDTKKFGLKRQHPQTIINDSNFEVLKYVIRGFATKRLIVFSSTDKEYCHEYYWIKYRKLFMCCECWKNNGRTMANIVKRNGKNIVQIYNNHVCKLREYKRIIEKPNFDTVYYEDRKITVGRLFVFLETSRTTCYEYTWSNAKKTYYCCGCFRKKYTNRADICKREDGTEFVMLKSNKHVCDPRKYNAEKYGEKQIIEAADFKLFKEIKDGNDKSKLIIFTSSEKDTCYEYYWNNGRNNFLCHGCTNKRRYIAAEVCQNLDGTDYVQLSRKKHVCIPRKYIPEKYEIPKIVGSENLDYKIFQYKHHGTITSKLVVFSESNKNLCYEYFWNKTCKKYCCSYCPFKKQVTASILQNNDDSKNFLYLSKIKHICDLREFDPEKFKDDIIVKKSLYNLASTTIRNIKDKTLTIFTSEEKKFYYKFFYNNQKKWYFCPKCFSPSKLLITAVIQNMDLENECCYVSNQKHICEPFEFSALTNGNIIVAPNFQLLQRKTRNKIIQRLVVFTNEEKSECFEYGRHSTYFICNPCRRQHKLNVYAKIIKNDENEECVELCMVTHKCKPIKFIPEKI